MSYPRAGESTPPRTSRGRGNGVDGKNTPSSVGTGDTKQIPGRYNLEIPADLQPLHKRVCLGLPGINPQHPDQVEDQLTSDKLRTGFFEKYLFKNETAQGCDMMYEQFTDRSKLLNMGNFLCKAIVKQRNDSTGPSEAASPSIEKVSLSEESRTNWLNTYTDPTRALSSLAHTVPHGLRLDKLIRQLEENRCTISHAVWVIRLYVLSEQSHKKLNPTTSTQEWTSQFIRVLERIMADLLKSSPSEEPFLEKGLKQWDYCTRLSQTLYAQDLLDKKSFLRWIVDVVSASTAKCTFMIPVIMTFLPDLFQSRILCLMMLRSIIPHYEQTLGSVDNSQDDGWLNTAFPSFCRGIIEVAMLQAPDVLVAPYLNYPSIITNWDRHIATNNYPHKEIIYRVLGINPRPEQIAHAARLITCRNKRFTDCPIIEEAQLTSTLVNPFEGFGPVSLATDLVDVVKHIFKDTKPTHTERIYCIICQLLAWVAKHGQKDPELKYLVCAVVKIWANAKVIHLQPSDPTPTPTPNSSNNIRRDCIETALLRYLDSGVEQDSLNDALLDLFSQLTRQGTFSYSRYLRRAIARGYLNPNFTPTAHRHLQYLSWLPAYAADATIAQHRKSNLQPPGFAMVHDFVQEQTQLDSLLQRLVEKLPAILGPPSPSLASQIVPTVDDPVAQSGMISPLESDFLLEIQNASRYVRGEVITYLMQGTMNYVIKDVKIGEDNWRVISKPGTALINVREFALVATVLEACQEYGALLELCLWLLVHTEERSLVPILVDVFRRHQSILIANGYASVVTAGVWSKHRDFKSTVNHLDKTTMLYLLHLTTNHSPGSTPAMKMEIETSFHSLIPSRLNQTSGAGTADLSEYIAELYDPPSDSSTLRSRAASLCMRYRNIHGWWGKLFVNSTQLVRHRVTSGLEGNGNKLVQMVRSYCDLFRFLGDFSLEPPAVLQEWTRPLLLGSSLPSASPVSTEILQWFMVYLSFLVARNLCSLMSILKLILTTVEAIIQHSLQQNLHGSYDHPLLQNPHLFLLIRLLLIHDGSQHTVFGNVDLAAQDVFLLDQVRHTAFCSIESLDVPFRLLYLFCLLETLLPSHHPLSEPLHTICRDLVGMSWFLKFGQNKSSELYARYMSDGGSPLKSLALSSLNLNNHEISLVSEEVVTKLKAKLMDLFLIILGDEAESTSIHFTLAFRPPSDQTTRNQLSLVTIESFEKDLVLINLYLERLLNGEKKSHNNKEIVSYIKNFFHGWVANPQLPEKWLIQAFEGVPSALWFKLLAYAEKLLSGDLDSPTREFPNYICHLKSKLTGVDINDSTKFSNQEILNNRAVMARFKTVVQTLLICTKDKDKDTSSDDHFNRVWNKKKFSFGSRILNELVSFSTSQEVFSIMMHANCTYSQALEHTGNPGGIYEAALQAIYSDTDKKSAITIDIVREAIQIRLEILIPLISSLVSHIELADLLKWIEAVFNIVASPLLLTSSPLFDFALDFFSYFMGELPKEVKADVFALLRKIHLGLSSEILADARILRLFPFEARSSFPAELRNPSLSQPANSHTKYNHQVETSKEGLGKGSPIPNVKPSFNPWEWDKFLVKDNLAKPISHFTPRPVSSLVQLNLNTECGSLLEAHQLEPPHSLPSTPMSTTLATVPRIASTTVHSRSKFATTARSAASPLMSFRSTLSPLVALQNSLLMISSSANQPSPLNPKP